MAGVYAFLRTIQRQQRESYAVLLRVPSLVSNTSRASVCTRSKHNQLLGCSRSQRIISTRNFSSEAEKPVTSDSEEKVDIGPGTWKEVYHGILATQIKMVKTFSLSTSAMGLFLQPVIFQKFVGTPVGVVVAAGTFVGFFTFVTPFLIHWITKKYVTSLEYDPERDVYSATTISFFLREKKIHFSVNDVTVPDVPGMFTTFHVKNKPLFVDPSMFKDLEHYGRLMGYDKPIDFHLADDEKKE